MQRKIPKNSFVRASFVILIATAIYQIINFLYHFISARSLGPEEYSIVASLFSIIYLVSIGATTIQNTITKFTADFNSKKESGKISLLYTKGMKKIIFFSVVIFVIFLIFSPVISGFLKIPILPVLLLSPLVLFFTLLPFTRGFLQGLQRFNVLGMNMIVEGTIKIVLAVALIFLGFKANGAIAAVSVSIMLAFFITLPYLKFSNPKKNEKIQIDKKEIYNFSMISFAALFLITLMYNADIFLIKHFFSATEAGSYAALSLLGKVVFFGATAIGLVMFSKISELHKKDKKESQRIFRKSLIFASVISLLIITGYFIFSDLIVKIVFGNAYSGVAGLLVFYSIFMMFVSLSYICVLKKLAEGQKKFILLLALAALAEIIAISLFHNTLLQVVTILIVINAITFIIVRK